MKKSHWEEVGYYDIYTRRGLITYTEESEMKAYFKNLLTGYIDLWKISWNLKGTALPAWVGLNVGILALVVAFVVTAAKLGFIATFLGVAIGMSFLLFGVGLRLVAKDLRTEGGIKVKEVVTPVETTLGDDREVESSAPLN